MNKVKRIEYYGGEVTEEACYDADFSADYALYLYWCQYMSHCDYLNKANYERYERIRTICKHSVMIEDGMDVVSCLATKEHKRDPLIGECGSIYDYQPIYKTN